MATYQENEDLINIGAYTKGSNPNIDRAILMRDSIEAFLSQEQRDIIPFKDTLAAMQNLVGPPKLANAA